MKRHALPLLQELLTLFPCVALLGVRQCGKTTLLQELPPDWRLIDLEKLADYEAVARDPDLFLRLNAERVAIDESQLLPALFPALRVAIDSRRDARGRFVITGSSSPELFSAISESLAGRVAIIEMAPFSSAEAYELPPSPFYGLVTEKTPLVDLAHLPARLSLGQCADY